MRALAGIVALALLAGCSTAGGRNIQQQLEQLFASPKGQPMLASGLRQYEDGQYAESAKNLQSALDKGLADKDKVIAYKHLAFIHCSISRERQCREEFRRALAIDPSLELSAAESGHPVWGPIFRSVKAGR